MNINLLGGLESYCVANNHRMLNWCDFFYRLPWSGAFITQLEEQYVLRYYVSIF